MKNFTTTIKYIVFILVLVFGLAKAGTTLAACDENQYGGFQIHANCSGGDDDGDDDDSSNDDLNVITSSATNIEDDSATLRGEITGINDTVERFFEWGTSSSNLNHTATVSGTTSHEGTFSKTISGLNDDDTYYFRACAEETDGNEDDCGSTRSFTTDNSGSSDDDDDSSDDDDDSSSSASDSIVTTDATNVGSVTATINGVVVNEDGSQRVWFEWGPTVGLGFITPSRTISAHESIVSSTISGLVPGHAYFFRLVSDSGDKGDFRAFVTSSGTVAHTTPTTPSNNGNTGDDDDSSSNSDDENGSEIIETVQYLNVDIIESAKEVKGGEDISFAITYENTSDKVVKNLIMTIDFPAGLTPTKSDVGTLNGQKVDVVIPSVPSLAKASFIINARVAEKLRNDTFLVSVVEASYDHPIQEDTRVETVNSSIVKVVNGNTVTKNGNQGASAGSAMSFFPHTVIGWILLVVVIGVVIFIATRKYKKHEDTKNHLKIVK